MLSSLIRLKEAAEKHAAILSEDFSLTEYLSKQEPVLLKEPFPHIVIDDFFKPETYTALTSYFRKVLERGTVDHFDPVRFRPFLDLKGEFEYDGYVYVPRADEDPALRLFFTAKWNDFFSRTFGQPLGLCTSFSLHYHPPNNRSGFVHSDYAAKWFSSLDRLNNGIVFRDRARNGGVKMKPQMRTVALIYYLNNSEWHQGDGGETALYTSKTGQPIELVAPKNNRLFAFQISPRSFHAFQNNKTPRCSLIQWFHIDPKWCEGRYGKNSFTDA